MRVLCKIRLALRLIKSYNGPESVKLQPTTKALFPAIPETGELTSAQYKAHFIMLDVTKTLISEFRKLLEDAYRAQFGDKDPRLLGLILESSGNALRLIAHSNASYHNVEHTMYVVAAGQAVLAGKRIDANVTSQEWTHVTMALLFHDVGFVPGLCQSDDSDHGNFYNGLNEGELIQLERGRTDASLMPYHVDRGQCYIKEHYGDLDFLDIEFIQQCIERTRFPIPDTTEYACIDDFPGLVRAADLIGQFSDPRYLNKLNALFQEFEEQGLNKKIGYNTLQDMRDAYPDFYKSVVEPYIKEGRRLLGLTDEGKSILESMDRNLEIASTTTATY